MPRNVFTLILGKIEHELDKTVVTEEPIYIIDMEDRWQFPCCWSAVDGCHISIKCPDGGAEAAKEYHNFKNFYSVILTGKIQIQMMQNTGLFGLVLGFLEILMIVADSAFPCTTWIMKPFTHATLVPEERNFNYRLSRARMVTEAAYGRLKGRFRVLYRKCECNQETMKP